jgi:hypothetical protein
MTKTDNHKKAMLEALEKSLGIVTTACLNVGIARETHYHWMKEDEQYAANVLSIDDMTIDFAESHLHKQIKGGNPTSTIFYLKTKGKKRGYVERTEIHQETTIKSLDINIIDEGIALSKSEKDIEE